MQSLYQSTNTKKTFTIVIITLALSAGYLLLAYFQDWPPYSSTSNTEDQVTELRENDVDYSESTDEQRQSPTEADPDVSEDNADADSGVSSEASDVGMAITAATTDGSGNMQVRTVIQTLDDNGTCVLEARKGSESVTQTVGTQAVSNSTTCRGFTVPADQLSPGKWSVTVDYIGENATSSASRQVEVRGL